MKTYSYKIQAKTYGDSPAFEGEVQAENHGEAIVKALVCEFGDGSKGDPAEALEEWHGYGKDDLKDQFSGIEKDDESFELCAGDQDFLVEVEER